MNLDLVSSVTDRLSSWAVIGAYALAIRGYVRQTVDVDIMTTDRAALHDDYWNDLRRAGAEVAVRVGDYDDPLGGVVRIRHGDADVDVVIARYSWQKKLLERAETVEVSGVSLRVPPVADLVLLKLFAGGYGDMQDVAALFELGSENLESEVTSALDNLPDEMRVRWETFLKRRREG
jgi:predicted nucleotidyltransferase